MISHKENKLRVAQSDIQKKFMRRVRFGKRNHREIWDRRMGKTHTLLKLVKPMFKRQHKKVQVFKLGDKSITVHKDTNVVLLDEVSNDLYSKIMKRRPDIRVIGLSSTWLGQDDSPSQEIQFK